MRVGAMSGRSALLALVGMAWLAAVTLPGVTMTVLARPRWGRCYHRLVANATAPNCPEQVRLDE